MLVMRYHPSHRRRTARGLDLARRKAVRMFRDCGYEGTYSASAYTLPFVLEWLERGKIPYTLRTNGMGYHLAVMQVAHSAANNLRLPEYTLQL